MEKTIAFALSLFFSFYVLASTPPNVNSKTNDRVKKKINKKVINGTGGLTLSYQALLSNNPMSLSTGFHGGGILIAPNCILTAKHVISYLTLNGIYTGQTFVGINNRSQATSPLSISRTVSNPNKDIGLVFLTNNLPNNPIKLASENNAGMWNAANKPLVVSGFGVTSSTSTSVSSDLRKVGVNTNSNQLLDDITCVGPGTNDACQGDSGGPLVNISTTGQETLTGVVSSDINGDVFPQNGNKNNCGLGGRYVKVSRYLDWIVEQLFLNNTKNYICTSGINIQTLPIIPDGCSYSWRVEDPNNANQLSSLVNITTGSSNSFITAAINSSAQGFVRIRLIFNSPTLTQLNVNKVVWVGSPSIISVITDGTFNFSGNTTNICKLIGYCFTSSNQSFFYSPKINLPNINAFSVANYSYSGSFPTANGSNAFFNQTTNTLTNDRACFGSNLINNYTINITANNSCGTNNRLLFVNVNNCGFRVYPNPATNIVNIEFENPEKPESLPNQIELIEEKSQKKEKVIDFKKEKQGKTTIVVKELARGSYFLKMSFDKKANPETFKLILE